MRALLGHTKSTKLFITWPLLLLPVHLQSVVLVLPLLPPPPHPPLSRSKWAPLPRPISFQATSSLSKIALSPMTHATYAWVTSRLFAGSLASRSCRHLACSFLLSTCSIIIIVVVIFISAHPGCEPGYVCLNAIQRRCCRVSMGESVTLTEVPPPKPKDYLASIRFGEIRFRSSYSLISPPLSHYLRRTRCHKS